MVKGLLENEILYLLGDGHVSEFYFLDEETQYCLKMKIFKCKRKTHVFCTKYNIYLCIDGIIFFFNFHQ